MLKGGKPMTKRPPFVNRRELIVASSALIAAPAVLRTGALAQDTGPIRLAGLLSLTGGGSPFGPNSRIAHQAVVDEVNAAGGGTRPEDRVPRRGRPDEPRSGGAGGAQADRC